MLDLLVSVLAVCTLLDEDLEPQWVTVEQLVGKPLAIVKISGCS